MAYWRKDEPLAFARIHIKSPEPEFTLNRSISMLGHKTSDTNYDQKLKSASENTKKRAKGNKALTKKREE
jgi:hypothetical protein